MSRSSKSLLGFLTAATLAAGVAGPAFADDDPPADPTPACYAEDGTPIFDPELCDLGRQASGH